MPSRSTSTSASSAAIDVPAAASVSGEDELRDAWRQPQPRRVDGGDRHRKGRGRERGQCLERCGVDALPHGERDDTRALPRGAPRPSDRHNRGQRRCAQPSRGAPRLRAPRHGRIARPQRRCGAAHPIRPGRRSASESPPGATLASPRAPRPPRRMLQHDRQQQQWRRRQQFRRARNAAEHRAALG